LVETPTEFSLERTNFRDDFAQVILELPRIVRPSVGEGGAGLIPHSFVGIEFRSVGRQQFQMDAPTTAEEGSHGVALMATAIVPDHDHMPPKMLEQLPQEIRHRHVIEIRVRQTTKIETDPTTLRADGESRDDRDLLMLQMVPVDRGLGDQSPGPAHGGGQEETAFVDEDEVGAQVVGVFFIRGQSSFFQRSIRSSSRSSARRSGFWQLKPIECNSRPIWSRWYRTPKSLSITSAIRAVVQRSVRYPRAMAPRSRVLRSRRFWAAVRREGRPGEAWTLYTPSPCRVRWLRQRMTELAGQPILRATALRLKPLSSNWRARRRRSARTSADPFGRILESSQTPVLHYLRRSQ